MQDVLYIEPTKSKLGCRNGRKESAEFGTSVSTGRIADVVVLDFGQDGRLHVINSQSGVATGLGMDLSKAVAFGLEQDCLHKMNFERLHIPWDAEVQNVFKTFSPLAQPTGNLAPEILQKM